MSDLFDFLTREFHDQQSMGHAPCLAAENCFECRRIMRTVAKYLSNVGQRMERLADQYEAGGPYALPETGGTDA